MMADQHCQEDNKTLICPKCGTKEALDTARKVFGSGMTDQQWESYKEEYVSKYIKED